MTSSASYGRLSLSGWAPCSAVLPDEALQQSRQLRDDICDACEEEVGVVRLFVAPDLPSAEPDWRLAAS